MYGGEQPGTPVPAPRGRRDTPSRSGRARRRPRPFPTASAVCRPAPIRGTGWKRGRGTRAASRAALGLQRLFGPTVAPGERLGQKGRRRGGIKRKTILPCPGVGAAPPSPPCCSDGPGSSTEAPARRSGSGRPPPPLAPAGSGRPRGGDWLLRPPNRSPSTAGPRSRPPLRGAGPRPRGLRGGWGSRRRGRPGVASRPAGPRRGLLTLVAMVLPVRAGLPVSPPRRASRLLGRCVRPARRRRWAAQAAPPQCPPVAAAWGPLGGSAASPGPRQAGADVAARRCPLRTPPLPVPTAQLGSAPGGSGGVVCPQRLRQGWREARRRAPGEPPRSVPRVRSDVLPLSPNSFIGFTLWSAFALRFLLA